MATQPIDDSGNYTQPTTLAGPVQFTGVATANTPESATEQARQIAQSTATNTFGPLQTEFVSYDQTRIVINGSGTGPFTYTATVVTSAIQIAPPSTTGLTDAEQAQFLKENNELVGDDIITPEEQQQLEQAGTPEEINVPEVPEQFVLASDAPDTIIVPEVPEQFVFAAVDPDPINVPTPEQIAFNEANLREPDPVSVLTPEQIAFNEANAVELPNIVDEPLADRQNAAFLEANAVELPNIVDEPLPDRQNAAFLEANLSEPESITEPLNIRETEALLEANMEPATIDPAELRVRETEALLEANMEPATVDDEFGDLEGAIRQQQNTQGLPVLNEDGTVAEGVKINPETGETYYTDNPSPEQESQDTGTQEARASGKNASEEPLPRFDDWRFRISLSSKNADYFYNLPEEGSILAPLKETNGVIYPYTPTISVTYNANYEPTDLAHTNYRIYNYKNSTVENITITGDFTAQDTKEANYMLAVIHFFRCATKMFYGKDLNPIRGTPPPLCYLNGHGTYGFNEHPVAITNFTLNYPTDVDYINAGVNFGTASSSFLQPKNFNPSKTRLQAAKLQPGGIAQAPGFTQSAKLPPVTRVPTKLQITITCIPIITRYDISNNFSLKDYSTGKLLRGSVNSRKGIW